VEFRAISSEQFSIPEAGVRPFSEHFTFFSEHLSFLGVSARFGISARLAAI